MQRNDDDNKYEMTAEDYYKRGFARQCHEDGTKSNLIVAYDFQR